MEEKYTTEKKGEILENEWHVEGLVVHTTDDTVKYVVTRVVSGADAIYKEFGRSLKSPQSHYVFSPENFSKASYRHLVDESDYRSIDANDYTLDKLIKFDPSLQVGDRLSISRWVHWKPHKRWNSMTGKAFEKVEVLESGIDIEEEENRLFAEKDYIKKNFAGIIRRLEQLQMDAYERISSDVPTLVRWNKTNKAEVFGRRFVFGEATIEDHFVDIFAAPYVSHREDYLGGDQRFTHSGRSFVARDIAVSGSTPTELVDERGSVLYEISVKVHSETKLNPEVDGLKVGLEIDGNTYEGVKDIEESSHYFDRPGHRLHFNAFQIPDEPFDGIAIAAEDQDALNKYSSIVHDLTIRALYANIDSTIARNSLSRGATQDIQSLQSDQVELLKDLNQRKQQAFEQVKPVIERIRAEALDTKLGTGGRLLIPKDKLDKVHIFSHIHKL